MKIIEMETLVAIAKLDGWAFSDRVTEKKSMVSWDVYVKDGRRASFYTNTIPAYTESFDAILPVINRQNGAVQRAIERGISESGIAYYWAATPAKLCELLVKSVAFNSGCDGVFSEPQKTTNQSSLS